MMVLSAICVSIRKGALADSMTGAWRFATLLGALVAPVLAQAPAKPAPTFALHIEEDPTATQIAPGYHRLIVAYTRVQPGFELEQFHPESENMYNVIVTRDGVPVPELPAWRALRDYRKVDRYPTIANPRLLKKDESWTTVLAVSDFFDMTKPGVYQVTVTRPSQPLNLAYSVPVRSNTISITVPPGAHAPVVPDVDKPKPRFELTVGPEPPDAQNSSLLRVEMDNTSNRTWREYKCEPLLGMYDLSVLRNGVPLEPNEQMQRLQAARSRVDCAGNVVLTTIAPGESSADDVPVGAFFDVSRPGTYSVMVSRETYPWEPERSVRVESNVYTFNVPEPVPNRSSAPAP